MSLQIHRRPTDEGILVVDYGSQYTLLIVRRLRECGVYAELVSAESNQAPEGFKCYGVILSGGPDSVGEERSRRLPPWVLGSGLPILGICYGMQLLADAFGLSVRSATKREYGRSKVLWRRNVRSEMAKQWVGQLPEETNVWMSHGDDVDYKSSGVFELIGESSDGVVAAIVHESKPIFGLQFHPEVTHTEFGAEILTHFAHKVCQAPQNWHGASMIERLVAGIQDEVGDGKVLVAVSGGVDSSVASVLLTKALGADKVTPVFVDTGLLRLGEVPWVQDRLKKAGLRNLMTIDAGERFLKLLQGEDDPERKRKKIGHQFIHEFEKFAEGKAFDFLGQGTLYPDVIESAAHGHGSKVIKSHHNVGGLPDTLKLRLIEPFRYLFKDEVREVGLGLGLDPELIQRHPFPGPGLAVRIMGDVTPERVRILQEADHVFIEGLREAQLYHHAWQAFVVFLPVRTVGVMGDNRTYQNVVALRAVTGSDAMTADVAHLPMDFLVKMADRIVRKVDGINRVVYDVTSKPPATIEWE